jgi:hypothetical protein
LHNREPCITSANIQRLVLLVLDNRHEAAIACKAPNGLSGHRRAFVDLTSAGDAIAKRLCINVYDDLVALAATQRLAAVLEISLSKRAERIARRAARLGRLSAESRD